MRCARRSTAVAVGLGVTRAQWKVLFKLTRKPGLRQVELADMLDLEPITLCRIVDRLEEARAGRAESRDPDGPARVAASRHRKGAAADREAPGGWRRDDRPGVCRDRPERHRNHAAGARARCARTPAACAAMNRASNQ